MPDNKRLPAFIFLFFLLLYAAFSRGTLAVDDPIRWAVARQMVRHGRVNLPEDFHTRNYAIGTDGHRYALWSAGQSIMFVPFAALELMLENSSVLSPEYAQLTVEFLMSTVLMPAVAAVAVVLFFIFSQQLGFDRRLGIIGCMLFGLGTMHFHYASAGQEQTQIAVFVLICAVLWLKNRQNPRWLCTWGIFASAGAGILFRVDTLVIAAPLIVAAFFEELLTTGPGRKPSVFRKWLTACAAGAVPFILATLLYNYIRFESVFETGNFLAADRIMGGRGLFAAQPVPTLAAMFFSPGKGIFWYNPILILWPAALVLFIKKDRNVALTCLAVVAVTFVFYSFYSTWTGDYAWGTRFQLPVLAFMVLPVLALLPAARAIIPITAALAAMGLVLNIASVIYPVHLEFLQNRNHSLIPDSYVWDISQSHITMRFDNIARHITQRRSFESAPVADPDPFIERTGVSCESVEKAWHINLYPFKARRFLDNTSIQVTLVLLWLCNLLLTGLAAIPVAKNLK